MLHITTAYANSILTLSRFLYVVDGRQQHCCFVYQQQKIFYPKGLFIECFWLQAKTKLIRNSTNRNFIVYAFQIKWKMINVNVYRRNCSFFSIYRFPEYLMLNQAFSMKTKATSRIRPFSLNHWLSASFFDNVNFLNTYE